MMPVAEAEAVQLIEIEALRQITDNLKRLNDRHDKVGELIARQTEMLHAMDARLIRIESNRLDADVARCDAEIARLGQKIETLEASEHRRLGAIGLAEWAFKNWPGVIGFMGIIVLGILIANGRFG